MLLYHYDLLLFYRHDFLIARMLSWFFKITKKNRELMWLGCGLGHLLGVSAEFHMSWSENMAIFKYPVVHLFFTISHTIFAIVVHRPFIDYSVIQTTYIWWTTFQSWLLSWCGWVRFQLAHSVCEWIRIRIRRRGQKIPRCGVTWCKSTCSSDRWTICSRLTVLHSWMHCRLFH